MFPCRIQTCCQIATKRQELASWMIKITFFTLYCNRRPVPVPNRCSEEEPGVSYMLWTQVQPPLAPWLDWQEVVSSSHSTVGTHRNCIQRTLGGKCFFFWSQVPTNCKSCNALVHTCGHFVSNWFSFWHRTEAPFLIPSIRLWIVGLVFHLVNTRLI